MESLAARPALSCCRRTLAYGNTAATAVPARLILTPTLPSGARQKSSSARTKAALRLPQHPSFLNLTAARDKYRALPAGADAQPTADQIIFNPLGRPFRLPHPLKFLPPTDPRRRENLTSLFSPTPSNQQQASLTSTDLSPDDLPSVYKLPPARPQHHLTKADIEEMRRLRAEDPVTNSVHNLAMRYKCTKLFVLMCCQAPKDHKEQVEAVEEKNKARWGPRKRQAREDRARRWDMVFGGQL
ncbi:hypothetical protein N0V88_002433 [Collariella sp. IMI 366227]|nr:hypothetical protein N0V88_002433 [Collariella sp. IMI 366227]